MSKSLWEPACVCVCVMGGYRIWARLLGYEVIVRPAGIEGDGLCVFEGTYGRRGRGGREGW